MVTVGMNYEILEGKEETFEKKFVLVIEAMADAGGHVKTRLYQDAFLPGSYLVVSEWSDKGEFDAFVTSEAFRKVTQWGRDNVLAGRPVHKVYEEPEGVPAAAPAGS